MSIGEGDSRMEYYAKSKDKILPENERKWAKNVYDNLIKALDKELEDWEKNILNEAQGKLLRQETSQQKTLQEHHRETIQCAENFFKQYGQYFTKKEKILILDACKYHDLGKVNVLFQMIVNPQLCTEKRVRPLRQIPHGFLSAVSISKEDFLNQYPEMSEDDFDVLVTAIYYHHTREDEFESGQIEEYCEKNYISNIRDFLGNPELQINLRNRSHTLFVNNICKEPLYVSDEIWNEYQTVKGMLNKFDWSASAGYLESEVSPDLLHKRLKANVESKLRKGLRPAQKFMKQHNKDNLVIVAPTGSGKTEAALLWLNGEKGFYTLPLKVSSNAIYKRIKENYSYEDVALLHSDSMVKYLEETTEKDGFEQYEKAKLLSAPLTISTVDQLFKFVYKALGTEIFAATLKYSKVVLDEIQAYEPRVIATLIYGLKTICQMGGKFAIITATFPPVLQYFMEQYGLIAQKQYLIENFSVTSNLKRHIVSLKNGEMNIDDIVRQGKEKKVLVICNTVSKAQEIYKKVSEKTETVYLLHSRFIRKHRDMLEKEIMKFSSEKDTKGIWITTQIVEASLDIDFDILFTEMCTCDSLLQRMGRCNRAGNYFPEEANIIVYDNKNGIKKIYDQDLYMRSLDYLETYKDVIFTEKMKVQYIESVYKTEEIKNTSYYKEIEKFLGHFDTVPPAEYRKKEVDDQFRMINSITVIPDSVYNTQQTLIEKINEFLGQPHMERGAKAILRAKLYSLTVGMDLRFGKIPQGVDRNPIKGSDIHRTQLKYEFDSELLKGRGLLLDQLEDEYYFA